MRHSGCRRVRGAGSPWLDPAYPPGGRADWRLADLEVTQEVGLDAQAAALEADIGTATGTQLPPVLTAEDAGQRALSWPPLRAALIDLMRRWDLLAERAPDDQRRNRTGQVRNLLQELVAAMDAENQALATGRDWRLLRPRVDQAQRSLSAVLAGVPQPGAICRRGALAARARRMTTPGEPASPEKDEIGGMGLTAVSGATSLRGAARLLGRRMPL